LRFSDGKITQVAHLEKSPYLPFRLSPDERFLYITQLDSSFDDLMIVENFR